MSDLIIAESVDTAVSLDLTVDQEGVGGVTGLTPTVAIRLSSSTTSYFDFFDSTFKTTGWTTKYQAMVDIERGHYNYVLAITALSPSLGDMYNIEYNVDNGASVVGDAADRLIVVASIADIPGDVWDETTALHTTAGTFGPEVVTSLTTAQTAQLLDIYRVLGLDSDNPMIVSKTERSAGSNLEQTIQENQPETGSVTVTRTT